MSGTRERVRERERKRELNREKEREREMLLSLTRGGDFVVS